MPAVRGLASEGEGARDFSRRFREPVEAHGLLIHQEPAADLEVATLDTGCTLWPAAIALSDAVLDASTSLPAMIKGKRVLELGAGTGLAGLSCAAAGAAEVVLTDLPHRLPLLQRNVMCNRWVSMLGGSSVRATALDWGRDDELEELLSSLHPDVVLGTDLVHEVEHAGPLVRTLSRIFAARPGACLIWSQETHNAMAVAALRTQLEEQLGLTLQQIGSFGARGLIRVGYPPSTARKSSVTPLGGGGGGTTSSTA